MSEKQTPKVGDVVLVSRAGQQEWIGEVKEIVMRFVNVENYQGRQWRVFMDELIVLPDVPPARLMALLASADKLLYEHNTYISDEDRYDATKRWRVLFSALFPELAERHDGGRP